MNDDDEARDLDFAVRPNRLHWPPLLYLLTLTCAYLLERFAPLPAPDFGRAEKLAGILLLAAGLGIAGTALLAFRRAGTPIDPTATAQVLMDRGIYRFTRNPMYLGAVLAFLGLGLLLHSLWLVLLMVPMAIALHVLAIRREEHHLEIRFGDAYRTFKAKVPRWIGPI